MNDENNIVRNNTRDESLSNANTSPKTSENSHDSSTSPSKTNNNNSTNLEQISSTSNTNSPAHLRERDGHTDVCTDLTNLRLNNNGSQDSTVRKSTSFQQIRIHGIIFVLFSYVQTIFFSSKKSKFKSKVQNSRQMGVFSTQKQTSMQK
jgi:hypothetical protein